MRKRVQDQGLGKGCGKRIFAWFGRGKRHRLEKRSRQSRSGSASVGRRRNTGRPIGIGIRERVHSAKGAPRTGKEAATASHRPF